MSTAELLEAGKLEPVNAICKRRMGRGISSATVWRWTRSGVKGGIRLPAVYACGCWCTTEAAFSDFLRRQTAERTADDDAEQPPAEHCP